MFGSLPVFFGGLLATLLSPIIVVLTSPRPVYIVWLMIEIATGIVRFAVMIQSKRAAALGRPTPTNAHIILSMCWAGCLGFGTLVSLTSGDWMIATMICVPAAAMIGGICVRNVATPRLATAMMFLSLGPLSVGAIMSGETAVIAIAILVPVYLFSMTMAAFAMNRMLVSTMVAEQESGHRAHHDDLTGLANRANLTRQMDERLTRTARAPGTFALFYLDLDGFKTVNDTYGHAAGDRVLQMVAEKLNSIVRIGDVTARIGGDEFVMLVDGVTEVDAQDFGERLVSKIARTYDIGDAICEIGVSIGIACAPQHGSDVRMLLAAADAALYSAKALGKCRVAMASVPDPVIHPLSVSLAPDSLDSDLTAGLRRAPV
jgi:diguanylate cyclase (GGDEF)-like protein